MTATPEPASREETPEETPGEFARAIEMRLFGYYHVETPPRCGLVELIAARDAIRDAAAEERFNKAAGAAIELALLLAELRSVAYHVAHVHSKHEPSFSRELRWNSIVALKSWLEKHPVPALPAPVVIRSLAAGGSR